MRKSNKGIFIVLGVLAFSVFLTLGFLTYNLFTPTEIPLSLCKTFTHNPIYDTAPNQVVINGQVLTKMTPEQLNNLPCKK